MNEPPQISPGKYARVECERRFLLREPPRETPAAASQIYDRYLTGTRLRLRRVIRQNGGPAEYKLTQKVPAGGRGPIQGLITNTYLSKAEYDLLCALPARPLGKTRFRLPPLAVDVFGPPLDGLVLAEAEFGDLADAAALPVPAMAVAEVTDDPRFTGGVLAGASRAQLRQWLESFGLTIS